MSTAAAVLDLTQLTRQLGTAARTAPQQADKVLADAAEQIYNTMILLVPRRSGTLARSIAIQASPGRYEIGPRGVPYASFVEFGTGIRGEFPTRMYTIRARPGKTLAFQSGGKTVFAKSVQHPGMRARPYVRPAAQAYIDSLPANLAEVGVKMILGLQ